MGRDGPEVTPEKVTAVSITANGKFRVDATINKENMLQRIHTWVDDPVLGDMNYEHEFTNASCVDLGNGIKFPTEWHSHQGWDDNYGVQAASAGHNAFGGTLKDIRPNHCPDALPVPSSVRQATFTELAEGYYYETIRENFIISDGVRNLDVHYVNPLQHVEGMLIAFLPKEGLLFEADLVGTCLRAEPSAGCRTHTALPSPTYGPRCAPEHAVGAIAFARKNYVWL